MGSLRPGDRRILGDSCVLHLARAGLASRRGCLPVRPLGGGCGGGGRHPPFRPVFSAFGVGLFANAVLPGRIGELARVAVLSRRIEGERRADTWATLLGTVFAARVFDLFPVLLLIGYVAATAKIPHWALASVVVFVILAFALLGFASASARTRL